MNRACECDDVDAPCARVAQRRCGCARSGAARIDVVDEKNSVGEAVVGAERTDDIAPPFHEREPALTSRGSAANEARLARELPAFGERLGETCGRMVSAAKPAVAVRRH